MIVFDPVKFTAFVAAASLLASFVLLKGQNEEGASARAFCSDRGYLGDAACAPRSNGQTSGLSPSAQIDNADAVRHLAMLNERR